MFQQMINGTVAVVTKPSVSTFEEHEQDNLSWALIYYAIAAVLNAIINVATFPLQQAAFQEQLEQLEAQGLPIDGVAMTPPSLVGAIGSGLIGTFISLFIYIGIVYLLGRAFGGTGSFGELAYDFALFGAPLSVVALLLNYVPFIGWIAGLALFIYNIYLTYLAIQAGMNLPGNKALYVMLILIGIVFVFACGIALIFGAALAALMGAAGA
jgi:hypothetical protein